jgi:hypothetical protein
LHAQLHVVLASCVHKQTHACTRPHATTHTHPITHACNHHHHHHHHPQDDLLYETLTVEETLNYAAALRLPRGTTAAQRRARVDDVITALGLGKCRGTIIGGCLLPAGGLVGLVSSRGAGQPDDGT